MGDVEGDAVPPWLVFTVFVLPPSSKGNKLRPRKHSRVTLMRSFWLRFQFAISIGFVISLAMTSRPLRPRRATILRGTQRMILSNLLKELLADKRRRFVPILDKASENLFVLSRLRTNFASLLFRRV